MSGGGGELRPDELRLENGGRRTVAVSAVIGVLGLLGAVGVALAQGDGGDKGILMWAWLHNWAFFLVITLGALVFVILQHLTRAGWSVVVRRLAEAVAGNIPLMAVLTVPLVLGMHELYPWSHADHRAHLNPASKQTWLSPAFWTVRIAIYFGIWWVMASFFHRNSVRQDDTGDVNLTHRMEALSAPAVIIFAITCALVAFDALMSLDPHWYSTIYGVVFFAEGIVGFMAVLAVIAFMLQRAGRLRHAITPDHYHDIGKLAFAFTVFWAYVAFSQYMLQWYANMPEETSWYWRRQSTANWTTISWVLVAGKFAVSFLILISRWPKRRAPLLSVIAIWLLVMVWVDMLYLVWPEYRVMHKAADPSVASLALVSILTMVGMGGLVTAATVRRLGRHSLVPERDPRLQESLKFENI